MASVKKKASFRLFTAAQSFRALKSSTNSDNDNQSLDQIIAAIEGLIPMLERFDRRPGPKPSMFDAALRNSDGVFRPPSDQGGVSGPI